MLITIVFYYSVSALDTQASFTIDKTDYIADEEITLHFSNLNGAAGYYIVTWEDYDIDILRQAITKEDVIFSAPIHKGVYRIDVFFANQCFSKFFTVTESAPDAVLLSGKRLEGKKTTGTRLVWENSVGDGVLTRLDNKGAEISYSGLNAGSFTDVNVDANAIYTYWLQANGYRSNSIVVDFSQFQSAEYIGNHNNGCIELTLNSPYMLAQGVKKQIDEDVRIIPFIAGKQQRVLLPIRAVIEEMGGQISWSNDRVVVSIWGKTLEIPIGQFQIFVDGKLQNVDVAAQIENNRTFVPIRYIEYLGCTIDWYQEWGQVLICYPQN